MAEDSELRDLVSSTLENAGVLAKIRAELRASVFLVLEEHEAFKGRSFSFTNKPLKDFLATQEGIIIVSLIREFLEFFGLEFTTSVFEPETQAGKDYEYVGRTKLAHDLKLNSGKKAPLIAQVLQESKVCFPAVVPPQKDLPNCTENSLKKEKPKDKDEKKEVIGNFALKAESQTNGLVIKTTKEDNVTKELVNLEGRSPPFVNSPPSFQSLKKPDSLKLDAGLNQNSPKTIGSSLSSLGALPPLGLQQTSLTSKGGTNRGNKQVSSDIKALLDLGLNSPENNYDEDFHASGSEKTSKGTNLSGSGSEVDEEMSVGADDQTSDHSGSVGSNKTSGES